MNPVVERGFIITKPDGSPWDEYLYPSRGAAEWIAKSYGSLRVYPARRVFSLRQASGTTISGRRELIIDRSGA